MKTLRSSSWGRIALLAFAAVALLLPATTAQAVSAHTASHAAVTAMGAGAVTAGASVLRQAARAAKSLARRCARNITVQRFVGSAQGTMTQECAHLAQVFADWFGREVFGKKVPTGQFSIAIEPSGLTLAKPDCAGYATYNVDGIQTSRVITYGSGC